MLSQTYNRLAKCILTLALVQVSVAYTFSQTVLSDVVVNKEGVNFTNDPDTPWRLTAENYLLGNRALISPTPASLNKESKITFTFEGWGHFSFLHRITGNELQAIPIYVNGSRYQHSTNDWRYLDYEILSIETSTITISIKPGNSTSQMILDLAYLRDWSERNLESEFGGKLSFSSESGPEAYEDLTTVNASAKDPFTFRNIEANIPSLESNYRKALTINSENSEFTFIDTENQRLNGYFNYEFSALDTEFTSWGYRVWDVRDGILSSPLMTPYESLAHLETTIDGPAHLNITLNHVARDGSDIDIYLDDVLVFQNEVISGIERVSLDIPDGEHMLHIKSDTYSYQPLPEADSTVFQYVEIKEFEKTPGYSIHTNSLENGRIELSPLKKTYSLGDLVSVRAIPDDGYRFVGWKAPQRTDQDNFEFRILDHINLSAFFAPSEPDPSLQYTVEGDANWKYIAGETLSLKSPELNHLQNSYLKFSVNGPGTLDFELDEETSDLTKGGAFSVLLNGQPHFDIENPTEPGLNSVDIKEGVNVVTFCVKRLIDLEYPYSNYPYFPFELNNISINSTFYLEASSIGPGSVSTSTSGTAIEANKKVYIEAIPHQGARFLYWQGIDSDSPFLEVTMEKSLNLTAHFEEIAPTSGQIDWGNLNWNTSGSPAPTIGGPEGPESLVLKTTRDSEDCFITTEVVGPAIVTVQLSLNATEPNQFEVLLDGIHVPLQSVPMYSTQRNIPIPEGNHQLTFLLKGKYLHLNQSMLVLNNIEMKSGYQLRAEVQDGIANIVPNKNSYNIGEDLTTTATPSYPGEFLGWTGSHTSPNEEIMFELVDHSEIKGAYGVSLKAHGTTWQTNPEARVFENEEYLYFDPKKRRSWLRTILPGPGILKFRISGGGYAPYFSHSLSSTGRFYSPEGQWEDIEIEINEDYPVVQFESDHLDANVSFRHIKIANWTFIEGLQLNAEGFGCEIEGLPQNQQLKRGQKVRLKANPYPGNVFTHWIIDGMIYSDQNEIEFEIHKHTKVIAVCSLTQIDFASSFETASPDRWHRRPSKTDESKFELHTSRFSDDIVVDPLHMTLPGPSLMKAKLSTGEDSIWIECNDQYYYYPAAGPNKTINIELILPYETNDLSLGPNGYNSIAVSDIEILPGTYYAVTVPEGFNNTDLYEDLISADNAFSSVSRGDSITLTANDTSNFEFSHWTIDGARIDSNPLRYRPRNSVLVSPVYSLSFNDIQFSIHAPPSDFELGETNGLQTLSISSDGSTEDALSISKTFTESGWLRFEYYSDSYGLETRLYANDEIKLFLDPLGRWEPRSLYIDASEEFPTTIAFSNNIVSLRGIEFDTTHTLTTSSENGTIEVSGEKDVYQNGDKVTATAIPDPGYIFGGWEGSHSSTENPITISPSHWPILRAKFFKTVDTEERTWRVFGDTTEFNLWKTAYTGERDGLNAYPNLNATLRGIEPETSGRIETTVTGPGILTFSVSVSRDTLWALYVNGVEQKGINADEGIEFQFKEGDHVIALEAAKQTNLNSITAGIGFERFNFRPGYRVQISTNGNYANFEPLKDHYELGEEVTITAMPELGNTFDRWIGDLSGASPKITIVVDDHIQAEAHFVEETIFSSFEMVHSATKEFYVDRLITPGDPMIVSSDSYSFTVEGPGTLRLLWRGGIETDPLVLKEDGLVLGYYRYSEKFDWQQLEVDLGEDRIYSLEIDGSSGSTIRKLKYTPSHLEEGFVDWVATHFGIDQLNEFHGLSLTIDSDKDGLPSLHEKAYNTDPNSPNPTGPVNIKVKDGVLHFEVSLLPQLYSKISELSFSGDLINWLTIDSEILLPYQNIQENGSILYSFPVYILGNEEAGFFTY